MVKTEKCQGCGKEVYEGLLGLFRYDNEIFGRHGYMHNKRVCSSCNIMMCDCYIRNERNKCKYCRGVLPKKEGKK